MFLRGTTGLPQRVLQLLGERPSKLSSLSVLPGGKGKHEVIQPMRKRHTCDHDVQIAKAFVARFEQEYERPITNRFIGGIMRKRLRLSTYKSHGIYVVPATEKPKVDQLCIRYGVIERSTCARKQ